MLSDEIKKKMNDISSSIDSLAGGINNNKLFGAGCIDTKGTIDNQKYIFKFNKAVTTEYYEEEGSSNVGCLGTKLTKNYSVASHNVPCGTRIYIPDFKGVINSTGVFEVEDTGGNAFDFDIFISKENINKVGKSNHDVYVLSWGSKKVTCSYTYITEYYKKKGILEIYTKATKTYTKLGGVLINFWMFNSEDKDIKDKDWYNEMY